MSYKAEYHKAWRAAKLAEDPGYRKREYAKYRQTHRESELVRGAEYRQANREKICEKANLTNRQLRKQILEHYSGSCEPFCKQCGFRDERALQIDHINNDGAQDREQHGRSNALYRFIVRSNFPKGYQVLCANCNTIKEIDRR